MSLADDLRSVGNVIHSMFLYAALTDAGFVKVGISRTPFERIYAINNGSPSPVRAAQWVWVGSFNIARDIEKAVRKEWAARHTRGEWYTFDYSQEAEKREFHDTLNVMFEHFVGRAPEWKRLGQKEMTELIKAGRPEKAKHPKKRHPWRHVP